MDANVILIVGTILIAILGISVSLLVIRDLVTGRYKRFKRDDDKTD